MTRASRISFVVVNRVTGYIESVRKNYYSKRQHEILFQKPAPKFSTKQFKNRQLRNLKTNVLVSA